MPKLIVHFENVEFKDRAEADEFSKSLGASSSDFRLNRRSRESSLDLTFENHYDGNNILDAYENAQGYLEFEDGTRSKHYVRRQRDLND
jgi:hypothetical protein